MTNSSPRKVCVVLVDRANYGRLKPVMQAIVEHPTLELKVICSGSMVLERFDQPVQVVRRDAFSVDGEIYLELEGSTPITMAKSTGFAIIEFASEFQRLQPDLILLIGDRYEALAAAIAGAYMNFTLCHVQGGEVSGSIDESARHAITKFAHFHFPSTNRAAEYLIRLGERPETILGIGCPSSDIARTLNRSLRPEAINIRGAGITIDLSKPYLLVVFHPITTEFGNEWGQMEITLKALDQLGIQTILLWPNIDAGSNHISKAIRIHRMKTKTPYLRTLTNLNPEDYLKVLANTACAIGNSSSFVRDASFFGTPVVLVGNRQNGRETDIHVTQVPINTEAIQEAVQRKLAHGSYLPSTLYGDGYIANRVAESLATLTPYLQKRLAFLNESQTVDEFSPAHSHR